MKNIKEPAPLQQKSPSLLSPWAVIAQAAEMARRSLNDLYLWVLYGGRERRLSEYQELIEAEGGLETLE